MAEAVVAMADQEAKGLVVAGWEEADLVAKAGSAVTVDWGAAGFSAIALSVGWGAAMIRVAKVGWVGWAGAVMAAGLAMEDYSHQEEQVAMDSVVDSVVAAVAVAVDWEVHKSCLYPEPMRCLLRKQL